MPYAPIKKDFWIFRHGVGAFPFALRTDLSELCQSRANSRSHRSQSCFTEIQRYTRSRDDTRTAVETRRSGAGEARPQELIAAKGKRFHYPQS